MENAYHKADNYIEKITELLYKEELIAKIKQNLQSCVDKYSWEAQEKKLLDLYKNLK